MFTFFPVSKLNNKFDDDEKNVCYYKFYAAKKKQKCESEQAQKKREVKKT